MCCLGRDKLQASFLGEVRFDAEWYDYKTKYSSGTSETLIPAQLPEAVTQEARHLAVLAVQAVAAGGLSRVDFFYEEDSGRLLINEINTLPGFTSQSMPMSWAESGIPLDELVHQLVELLIVTVSSGCPFWWRLSCYCLGWLERRRQSCFWNGPRGRRSPSSTEQVPPGYAKPGGMEHF